MMEVHLRPLLASSRHHNDPIEQTKKEKNVKRKVRNKVLKKYYKLCVTHFVPKLRHNWGYNYVHCALTG